MAKVPNGGVHVIVEGMMLSAPPPGYYWVQSGTDYLLVATGRAEAMSDSVIW